MKADSIWKEVLEKLFVEFLQFFFPDIHQDIDFSKGYQFLDKEFQQITKSAKAGRKIVDKLVRVYLKDGREQWLLIHIEIQGRKEKDFARRMFIYNYRIFDRYQREVISLALLTDRDVHYRPNYFEIKRWNFSCTFKFPLIKIIDYVDYPFEQFYQKNPFSMVTQAYLKTMEVEGDNQQCYRWRKYFLLKLLDLGLRRETIYAIYQFIEWLMELPEDLEDQLYHEIKEIEEGKEMSLLTIAEKKGMEQGIQQGIQQGLQQGKIAGKIEGLREAIKTALEIKFGQQSFALFDRIEKINTLEELEKLLQQAKQANRREEIEALLTKDDAK